MFSEGVPMHVMRDASRSLRRKQFEAGEKERRVALLGTMIMDFDNMIADLDGQIAAEEDRTKINDTAHPAYSTFAIAAAKRRQNLLISAAHMKSMLDVAKRELHEITAQLLDLEPIQNKQPSRTTEANSAAR
jgi:flagellar protein FliJ